MSDQRIINAIAAVMAADGWTCEYHEPDATCDQCRESHQKTATNQLAALRAAGIAVVELPEPGSVTAATDDENGHVEWSYPHGSVAVTDDGTIMWGQWHIHNPQKVASAAAALLAAANKAEESK
ncbi:hypothetical protein MHPYR_180116 [uncultured Mycobacterium sp.]|uniref:Uncharacterized protein n=1 Tax=uncultured Mycobacterium sp. TaxID=171292 RepID=A0A1Y5P5H5_9MYCO|nr:hypothetical protein MHPYR_180116 [uncultured Mycobacterium sp.]